jgi:prepilin-type N-terminal cleavage/methylation domain-containing protein
MLNKLKKTNQEGFTIIEVLIVLAIAGLILLIVFLAVPALQRNARNTNRKNDASALAAAVSEYEDNNNGTPPTTPVATGNAGTFNLCQSSPCSATESPAQFKLGYYTKIGTGAAGDFDVVTTLTNPTNVDELLIEVGFTCSGNAATASGASSRSLAVVYDIESGSGYSEQCTAS